MIHRTAAPVLLAIAVAGCSANADDISNGEAASSAEPTCLGCDIDLGPGKPVTNLVDDAMVQAVSSYDCAHGKDDLLVPYFSGIQGLDDTSMLALLGGDEASANFYAKFALQGVNEHGARWSLLNYYNAPKQNVSDLSVDVIPGSLRTTARGNHSWLRQPVRGNDQGGSVQQWGDQLETRLLSLWASTPNAEEFVGVRPQGRSPNPSHRTRDEADFAAYSTQIVRTGEWTTFMYRATRETAIALKCGVPVFAHSGGGAVVTFILRLLQESRLGPHISTWKSPFVIVGLEAVFLTDARDALNSGAYRNSLQMNDLIVGPLGSKTWSDVIVPEVRDLGSRELAATPIKPVDPPGWNGDGAGHAGLGMWTLLYGRAPE